MLDPQSRGKCMCLRYSEIDMPTGEVWLGNLSSITAKVQCCQGNCAELVILRELQKQEFLLKGWSTF